MTTRLQRAVAGAARRGLRRWGEAATRIRPLESKVSGQTVKDLDTDKRPVRVVIAARSGKLVEQGWGQSAAGEYMALVEPDETYEVGDLVDADAGAWEGERFRVTFVDRQASLVALERVHAGNA